MIFSQYFAIKAAAVKPMKISLHLHQVIYLSTQ